MQNLTITTELYNTTDPELYMFSNDLIIWIYNENLYKNVNFTSMVYLCVLSILGIIGNFLIIYIYGFIFRRTIAHFFILSLAMIDTLCCFAMVMEIFDKRFPMYSGNYRNLCKVTRFIEMFGTVVSSLILLCIALDRYYKICRPFTRFTYQKARTYLTICIVTGLLLSWPIALFHGPEMVDTGAKNVFGLDCGDDDNFKNSIFPTIYFGFMGILNVIAIFLLAIMYICIFRAILKWKRDNIGESVPSSTESVVSMSYSVNSRVMSWLKRGKPEIRRKSSEKHCVDNGRNTDRVFDYQIPSKCINSEINHSDVFVVQNGGSDISLKDVHVDGGAKVKTYSINNFNSRPSRKGSKKSKTVTKNTIAFSIVTVIYIIAYLPTICVETLNASGVYREEALSYTIRNILGLMNVSYFLNNVCNQYVYSLINPTFRKQVKQIFTGP